MFYKPLTPPISINKFREMSSIQAKEFYCWFVSQIDDRIAVLQNLLMEDSVNVELDFSPNSLIPLWEWYENKICYIKKSSLEIEQERRELPDWAKNTVIEEKISNEAFSYGVDLAIYVSKMFIINSNNKLYIDYVKKPKRDYYYNQPAIFGFSHDQKIGIIQMCNSNLAKQSYISKDKNRLYNYYIDIISEVD